MPQLLLEFFSEEIPARMQKRAEEDLARALGEKLRGAGLEAKAIKTFSSPRRIGAVIDDLAAKAADVNEEKKGPRVGAPDQAIQGFLKSAGLSSIEQAQVVEDKKGAFYVARIERAGRETSAILQEIIPEIVRGFPWPKSMRSGEGDLQWVRPLQNILCIFAGAPVKIAVDAVPSEAKTWGHRFHAPDVIRPKDFADYAEKLRAAKVEIDRDARKAAILEGARRLCAEKKLELVEDVGLLEEVAGLVEWPVVLLGDMDKSFLDLPGEVIRLSMRTHQKYFAVRDPKTQKLAPHFVVVANVEGKDGGKAIAAGNARVLSARLNDARFFWDTDRKTPLYTDARRDKLEQIVFHQKLGSVWDKVERVKALAVELAPVVYGPPAPPPASAAHAGEAPAVHDVRRHFATLEHFIAAVQRAAELCKMDLVTETVGEFPELQGQVGRALYLAELNTPPPREGRGQGVGRSAAAASVAHDSKDRVSPRPPTPSPLGEGESIALAIEDHYRPLGPNDHVPSDPVAVTLALADKLDTLVGFWAIDEKPTGSSDPYALRRAALGLVRIVLHNSIRFAEPSPPSRGRGQGEGGRAASQTPDVSERPPPPTPSPQGGGGRRAFQSVLDFAFLSHYAHFLYPGMPRDYCGVQARERFESADQLLEEFEIFERAANAGWNGPAGALIADLLSFLADRLKVQLRDQGKRHDLVDAVFALGDDDLVRIVARVEALDAFLKTEDGANLLAGYKRAANILAAEEKKGKWSAEEARGAVDAAKLAEPAEKALHAALETALPAARAAVGREDFAAAMKALSGLRASVDEFFEKVLVNAEDASVRLNRLLLLSGLREALSQVADFSKIEG